MAVNPKLGTDLYLDQASETSKANWLTSSKIGVVRNLTLKRILWYKADGRGSVEAETNFSNWVKCSFTSDKVCGSRLFIVWLNLQ